MELPVTLEKETRHTRDEPEKVVKQWERDPTESERSTTDDEESKQTTLPRSEEQEQDRSSSGAVTTQMLVESKEAFSQPLEESDRTISDSLSLKDLKTTEAASEEADISEKTEEDDVKE